VSHDLGYDVNDVIYANNKLSELDFKKKFSEFGDIDIFIVPKTPYFEVRIVKFNDDPDISLEQVKQIKETAVQFLNQARSDRLKKEREQASQNPVKPAIESPAIENRMLRESLVVFRVQKPEGQSGEIFILVNFSNKTYVINSTTIVFDSLDKQVPAYDKCWEYGRQLKPGEGVVIAHSEKLISVTSEDMHIHIGTEDGSETARICLVKNNFPAIKIDNNKQPASRPSEQPEDMNQNKPPKTSLSTDKSKKDEFD
jgi:hypothetical protein